LRRDRHQRLVELTTGDGRPLPVHLKTQIRRKLDRLELLLDQIKEAERDALLAAPQPAAPAPAGRMLLEFKGIGADLAAVLWLRRYFATLTIAASSRLTLGWRPRPGNAAQSITSRVFPRPGIRDCRRLDDRF
jgi:transposase